jgi:hypothetical protein
METKKEVIDVDINPLYGAIQLMYTNVVGKSMKATRKFDYPPATDIYPAFEGMDVEAELEKILIENGYGNKNQRSGILL